MIDWLLVKDIFALIGIYTFSYVIVFGSATLMDNIHLWGTKKGVRKWLES